MARLPLDDILLRLLSVKRVEADHIIDYDILPFAETNTQSTRLLPILSQI